MDFRFHEQLRAFILDQGLDQDGTDIVRVAGAARGLARLGEGLGGRFLLEQLQISLRLHEVRQIILVHHEDCGAYGLGEEVSGDEEMATHREDLRKARAVLEKHFPGVEVLTYFMRLNGSAEKID
jgi:carbonic anhydrase